MELNHTPLSHNKTQKSSYYQDSLSSASTSKARSESIEQRSSSQLSLAELKEGQILKGEVVDIRYQEVKIKLEPSQQVVTARMANDSSLSIGQEAHFEVAEVTENTLILKLSSQSSTVFDSTVQKALQASSLPLTARNKELVSELLRHQLPIDKQTLQNLSRTMTMYKEISLDVIITAFQHKIPFSKENFTQLTSFLQGDGMNHPNSKELTKELVQAIKNIFINNNSRMTTKATDIHHSLQPLDNLTNQQANSETINGIIHASNIVSEHELLPRFIDSLLSYTLTIARQEDSLASIFHGESLDILAQSLRRHVESKSLDSSKEAIYQQILIGSADVEDTMNFINSIFPDANSSIDQLMNQLLDKHISDVDKSMLKPLLERLYEQSSQLNQTRETLQENLSHILQSPVSRASLSSTLGDRANDLYPVLEELLEKRFAMDSEDFKSSEAIPAFYRRLSKDMDSILSLVKYSHDLKDSDPLPSNVKEVNNGIQFMKTMEDIFQFLPVPLQFHKAEGKGELYVYRKKTALTNRQDSLNIFLHLDMVHLGAIDIQLLLQTEPNRSLNATFYTENEATGNLLQANLQELSLQLQKTGYHFQGHVQWDKPLNQPLVDLLDGHSFDLTHNRYAFDVRA